MPGGLRARRYSLRLPFEAYSTRTYSGPAGSESLSEHCFRLALIVPSGSKRGLTVLRARSQQVDDIFVFSDHLHHLHLGHQV